MRDPDLILTTTAGPASFATRPEWQVVRAVRERRFLQVTGSRVRPAGAALAGGDPSSRRAAAGELADEAPDRVGWCSAWWPSLWLLGLVGRRGAALARRGLERSCGAASAPASVIVRELRVPRVLLAFLVGGSLAVCGAALQAMIRNPLAEPYLLGLSGGAGLGAVIALASRSAGPWAVPVAAFAGALAAVGLVYRLSLVAGRRLDPRVLLLSGVVVGSFAGALMSAIIVLSDAPTVRNAFLWLLGGFGAASWQALAVFAAYAVTAAGRDRPERAVARPHRPW